MYSWYEFLQLLAATSWFRDPTSCSFWGGMTRVWGAVKPSMQGLDSLILKIGYGLIGSLYKKLSFDPI